MSLISTVSLDESKSKKKEANEAHLLLYVHHVTADEDEPLIRVEYDQGNRQRRKKASNKQMDVYKRLETIGHDIRCVYRPPRSPSLYIYIIIRGKRGEKSRLCSIFEWAPRGYTNNLS